MKHSAKRITLFILAAVVLGTGLPAAAQEAPAADPESPRTVVGIGDEVEVEGIILDRDGDTLTVRLSSAQPVPVKLTALTQVREKKSNPFRRGRKYLAAQLTPGLPVVIKGRHDSEGAVVAEKISITNNDLKMAQVVNTRVAPVEQNSVRMSGQINELNAVSNAARGGAKAAQATADSAHSRIAALDDYDTVRMVTVQFKAGSAVLSESARRSLDELASEANRLKGYVIEVAGFASSEGSLSFNRRLSRQRAEAVSEYLAEEHDIPLRRIMNPTGYGISHPVADNASREGRQENRRVEVRLLMSRGITAEASSGVSAVQPVNNQ